MKPEKGSLLKKGKEAVGRTAGRIAFLPLKGVGLTLKAVFSPFFRRYPWLKAGIILFAVILLLALIGPAAGLLTRVLDLLAAIFKPLVESSAGRFVLLNLSLLLLAVIAWRIMKDKVVKTLGAYVLSR